MGDHDYDRAIYEARGELFKRQMERASRRYHETKPLKIDPIPMSFGGYLASKLDHPLAFYGAVAIIAMLTGALVAWILGAP